MATLISFLTTRGFTISQGGKVGITFQKLTPDKEGMEVQFVINNVVVRRRTRREGYRATTSKIRYPWRTTHVGYLVQVKERAGKLVGIRRVEYGRKAK